MEIFVRFLFDLKILNKFFYFLLLIFLCFQTSIAQANEGNKKIESFSKSKNFLKNGMKLTQSMNGNALEQRK